MTPETPAQESAMTEIALALAMGFFSIMVLTIISMGSGAAQRPEKLSNISLVKVVDDQRHSSAEKNVTKSKNQKIIIFDGTQFLDAQFRPLTVEKINSNPATKDELLVLAMPPELSIKDALLAKNRIHRKNLVVSHLNEAWLAALRSRK